MQCYGTYLVRQDGSSLSDKVMAAAATLDDSVIMGGHAANNTKFMAAKIDTHGDIVWYWEVSRVDLLLLCSMRRLALKDAHRYTSDLASLVKAGS